jgi:hypothetical protein
VQHLFAAVRETLRNQDMNIGYAWFTKTGQNLGLQRQPPEDSP